MNIDFIESKINEILQELEKEAMHCIMNENFDKKTTNLYMKPIVSAKQILLNAIDSIKMADKLAKEELEK
ncbi:MAG: hypothetical protein IE880_00455 [Epsilonproteobacteria bacterium]|nr:hypothetical protein [Campylobacterota bacterium]